MGEKQITRLGVLSVYITIAICFYIGNCLAAHSYHPDIPWLESGVYDRGPFGIVTTMLVVSIGFANLLFRKSK
jgi:hypothetical protein